MAYYETPDTTIYHGDCLDVLPTLESESVQCCVTSPPYWGLRDYGTATWEGGDESCDHRPVATGSSANKGCNGGKAVTGSRCAMCGAVRGEDSQLGLEPTPEQYIENMVAVFREVRRVLRDDGTLWLNLGDSYNSGACGGRDPERWPKQSRNDHIQSRAHVSSLKHKDLVGIPWRVALALQSDGWYLRQDIIWQKPNPMPESVRDRCTKAHEYIFLLTKSASYCYDADAVKEPAVYEGVPQSFDTPYKNAGRGSGRKASGNEKPGSSPIVYNTRNKRSVWTVSTKPFKGAHFATFPPDLIEPCILAGCPDGGLVLDPFHGAGTTAMVAQRNGRRYVGCELNAEYIELSKPRLQQPSLL